MQLEGFELVKSQVLRQSRAVSAKKSTTKSNLEYVTLISSKKAERRLFNNGVEMCEIGIQTEEPNQKKNVTLADVPEGHPDSYIKDWWHSIVFKKAMKGEAIKRGEHYDSEFEVNEEDEHIAMTIITKEEGFDA